MCCVLVGYIQLAGRQHTNILWQSRHYLRFFVQMAFLPGFQLFAIQRYETTPENSSKIPSFQFTGFSNDIVSMKHIVLAFKVIFNAVGVLNCSHKPVFDTFCIEVFFFLPNEFCILISKSFEIEFLSFRSYLCFLTFYILCLN